MTSPISGKCWNGENFDTLSMEYYDRERIDGRVGMTVYDYMSMVIGECRAYVENFGREKGSILFTGGALAAERPSSATALPGSF